MGGLEIGRYRPAAASTLQYCWAGIALGFAFGIGAAANSERLWKKQEHPMLERAFAVVQHEFEQECDSAVHSELLHFFIQLNSEAEFAKIRKDVCGRSGIFTELVHQ